MGCATCGGRIGPRNTSGYCRQCFAAANAARLGAGAKISAGLKRKYARDPKALEELRDRARLASAKRDKGMMRQRWLESGVYRQGLKAMQRPEVRAKAGRAISAAKLAWCPAHLRQAYRDLLYVKRFKAAEARAMILAQHASELERWKRRNPGNDNAAPSTRYSDGDAYQDAWDRHTMEQGSHALALAIRREGLAA